MSNKTGYGNKSDSIVGTSFQNILPKTYGKVSTGSSDAYVTVEFELPSLPTFQKWDVHIGIPGRKYCIKDELVRLRHNWKILFGIS